MRTFSKSICLTILLSFLLLIQGCAKNSVVASASAISPTRVVETRIVLSPAPVLETKRPELVFSETATQVVQQPLVIYSGAIALVAGNADLSISAFDFDSNQAETTASEKNDIAFGLTDTRPYPILVLGPSFGAAGALLQAKDADFNFENCSSLLLGKGGIPIPALGSYYCWRTNEGRMVEFTVEKIDKIQGSYKIEIRYVVWDNHE